jgi:hypothetical protein
MKNFAGKTIPNIGMDSWTFCESLGPTEGNRWMK